MISYIMMHTNNGCESVLFHNFNNFPRNAIFLTYGIFTLKYGLPKISKGDHFYKYYFENLEFLYMYYQTKYFQNNTCNKNVHL